MRVVAGCATVAVVAGGWATSAVIAQGAGAQTVTRECSLVVPGESSYTWERSVTVHAQAPDAVTQDSTVVVEVAGAPETLPDISPHPQFLVGYTSVTVSYTVTGGNIVPGSVLKTASARINGVPTQGSVTPFGSSILTQTTGPLSPGEYVAPAFRFAVAPDAAGTPVEVVAAESSDRPGYATTTNGAQRGNSACDLSEPLATIDVTGGDSSSTNPPTTETTSSTTIPTTTTTPTAPPITGTTTSTPPTTVDPTAPKFSVADVSIAEPVKGTVDVYFVVAMDTANPNAKAQVRYRTVDGTALHSVDFSRVDGQVKFQKGKTSQQIRVKIKSDKISDPDETFSLELYDAKGGVLARPVAVASITGG